MTMFRLEDAIVSMSKFMAAIDPAKYPFNG